MAGVAFTSVPCATSSLTRSRLPDCTASCKSAPSTTENAARTPTVVLTHVLHLLLHLNAETIANPLLEVCDQRAEIERRARAVIVNQICMIGRDLDVAQPRSLGSHLFEKPRGRNLALPYDGRGNLSGDPVGQLAQQKILEDAPGALHGGGKLFVAHLHDIGRDLLQSGCGVRRHVEIRREDDPLLVTLENAFPVGELALVVTENPDAVTVKEADALDTLVDRMAIRAGIAIDRRPDPPRNAGQRLQPFQTVFIREIHQIL